MKRQWPAGIVLLAGLLCFVLIWGMYRYEQVKSQSRSNMSVLFKKAIQLDKKEREVYPIYALNLSPKDTLVNESKSPSYQDKWKVESIHIIEHLALADVNPISPQKLDSLYRILLQYENIPAQTAVKYQFEGHKAYSTIDTSFYASSCALDTVFIGMNEGYGLTLQAFVRLPWWYLLTKMGWVYWGVLMLCLFLIIICRTRYEMFNKRKNKISITKHCMIIAEDLFFDKEQGRLFYQNQEVVLITNRLKLFIILLDHKNSFVTSDYIWSTLWADGLSSKEVVPKTISRLRKDLEPIPCFRIESERSKGYKLRVIEA